MTSRSSSFDALDKGEGPLRESFGVVLRKRRILHGELNQQALSRRAGLPEYVVGSFERGERPLYLLEIIKICLTLEIDVDLFLEDVLQELQRALEPIVQRVRGGEVPPDGRAHRSRREELSKAIDVISETVKDFLLREPDQRRRADSEPEAEDSTPKDGRKRKRKGR